MKTPLSRVKKSMVLALPLAAICFAGCWDDDSSTNPNTASLNTQATAPIRGYTDSTLRGTINFLEEGDSILVQGSVSGLTPGMTYAIHVHQFGNCSAPDSSGDHFAGAGERHGNPFDSLPLHHRGDLPSLQANGSGVGLINFMTNAMNLGTDSTSVLGRSVVVHALPDDYITQPAGGSDGRIACGVIGLLTGNPADTTNNPVDTTNNPVDTTLPGRPPTY
jgi:superoxide dismutase, Cu-Zn family